jgi:hypothetical protein
MFEAEIDIEQYYEGNWESESDKQFKNDLSN